MHVARPFEWFLAAGTLAFLIPAPVLPAAADNQPPVANAGGPYVEQCQGNLTLIQLDGTGSYDPDGTPLEFFWFEECPNAWFDDPTSPTPVLTVMDSGCEYYCRAIDLTVTSGGLNDKAHAEVTVSDTVEPMLVMPGDVYQPWGIDPTPEGTGWAIAVDTCDPDPLVSYTDFAYAPPELGIERIIERTWTAQDVCGNKASKTQRIHLLGTHAGGFNLEVDPSGCTDEFYMRDPAQSLSVYIGGGPRLDVSDIDLSSLHFSMREAPSASMSISALAGPTPTDVLVAQAKTPTECNPAGTDGWLDLPVVLNRSRMCSMMKFGLLIGGENELFTVVGQRKDGSWFWAQTDLRVLN